MLDNILKQIQRKRLLNPSTSDAVDASDQYFNHHTRLINRTFLHGIKQSAIREAINAADQVIAPATGHNLTERYEGARRKVWTKIDRHQLERAAIRTVKVVCIEPGATLVEQQMSITQTGNGIIQQCGIHRERDEHRQ